MTRNWQQQDWPHFRWDDAALTEFEAQHLRQSGILLGASRHVSENDRTRLIVELITDEAVKTSQIEGELLDRESVQSSILRNFGLTSDHRRVQPAERGIADMLTDVYKTYHQPLTHETLFRWHEMLTNGRHDLTDIGRYRTHSDPMQIVSGRLDKPKVHFEAPPSESVSAEMDVFMAWWADTSPKGRSPLPSLTRAGVAHLFFVCVHPFEDGNGRIGRALAEKSLAEYHGSPTLIALSKTIERARKEYYKALERNNKGLDITEWLVYFARTFLEAQATSQELVDFLIAKTKLYDRLHGRINERQRKVLKRMFREGLDGFKGGLSADNYMGITGASRATATRDLVDLVEKGALTKTGKLKGTRYWLNLVRSSNW
ncbi:MAG: Fic family protein [Wenzhouxiangella sp.]|jgi:Fic family protein|nr:Fic family protein [Wenzhouxiangella sp.]